MKLKPSPRPVHGKITAYKTGSGAKKVGDCWSRGMSLTSKVGLGKITSSITENPLQS